MNRSHKVQLVDLDTPDEGGTIHAEVIFHDRGPGRFQWRARCLECDWRSDLHDEPGRAVDIAYLHGLTVHE